MSTGGNPLWVRLKTSYSVSGAGATPISPRPRATAFEVSTAAGCSDAAIASARAWSTAASAALLSGHSDIIKVAFNDTELLPVSLITTSSSTTLMGIPIRPLGRGAFGAVTLSSTFNYDGSSNTDSVCAVKQVDFEALTCARQSHSPQRELRALTLIANHQRHISGGGGFRFLQHMRRASASSCGRWLYIVSDAYLSGDTLSALRFANVDCMDTPRGLPIPFVRAIAACLLASLIALRSVRLAHRDIKPSNICIDKDGLPRLIDFGFSKSISSKKGEDLITNTTICEPPLSSDALVALSNLPACCECPDCFSTADISSPTIHRPHIFHSAADSAIHGARVALRCGVIGAAASVAGGNVDVNDDVIGGGKGGSDTPLRRRSVVGSIAHMAPEIESSAGATTTTTMGDEMEGREERGCEADVWSWGVTIFELISGMSPFSRKPAWAGEEGSAIASCVEPDAAATAARARLGDATTLPHSITTAWPALTSLLALALNPIAARRATPSELLSHPAFTESLICTGEHLTFWEGPIDANVLLGDGPLPPIPGFHSSNNTVEKKREGEGAQVAVPKWGIETYEWGSSSLSSSRVRENRIGGSSTCSSSIFAEFNSMR
jgi:serine/threonine protein kinase